MLLVVGMLAFAAGCGGDDDEAGGTTAEATARPAGRSSSRVPPTRSLLDGALVSDGESLRVITQIFETLVASSPARPSSSPASPRAGEPNDDGTVWTFKLREGVKFHDGTDLNAEAVCFNFDRWYNFKGPLQNPARHLLLAGRLRRLQDARQGQRRPGGQPLQELRGDRLDDGRADADEAVGDVHPGALAAVVLDREPEGAEGVQGRRGHDRRGRRLPSDGDVRHRASDRHRPVQVRLVDAERQADARQERRLLGRQGASSTS